MQPGGNAFVGEWDEEVTSFAYGTGTAWNGTRQTGAPVFTPEFSSQIEWLSEFDFNDPAVLIWLNYGGEATPITPSHTPRPAGVTCPVVVMDVGLSASNNPYVTQTGIADATSAPWTIFGQPPAAPLGSLSFRGNARTLQLDACIPLFGLNFADQRRDIQITGAVLVADGNGDFQGNGRFYDPALG